MKRVILFLQTHLLEQIFSFLPSKRLLLITNVIYNILYSYLENMDKVTPSFGFIFQDTALRLTLAKMLTQIFHGTLSYLHLNMIVQKI